MLANGVNGRLTNGLFCSHRFLFLLVQWMELLGVGLTHVIGLAGCVIHYFGNCVAHKGRLESVTKGEKNARKRH